MQSLSLDVNVVSEEGTGHRDPREEDDLLRAAEELGIDLLGVRATTRTESSPRTRPPTKRSPWRPRTTWKERGGGRARAGWKRI